MNTDPIQQSLFDPSEPIRKFDGITYDARDCERLTGQVGRVFELMRDGKWRSLSQIMHRVRGTSEAGISARIRDLRKEKWGMHTVEHRRLAGGLWEYRLLVRK